MKILIVDDSLHRYSLFMDKVVELGIPPADIDFANCIKDAWDNLLNNDYDLLVLDLLVPFRCVDLADTSRYTMDLLMELQHGNELSKPGHIIGITSNKEEALKSASKFEQYTWSLIEYSPTNLSWMFTLLNYVGYLLRSDNTESMKSQDKIDVVILCALKDPEFESLMQLPWYWEEFMPISDNVFVRKGFFYSNGKKITVAATHAQRMGMVTTAILSSYLINYFSPKVVAMVGICAGVKGKVNIGDVVFADPAWDYQSGKIVRENDITKFSSAPHHIIPSQMVRTWANVLSSDGNLQSHLKETVQGYENKIGLVIGPMATGSAVLADENAIVEIKCQHRELVAIEMETYGLFSAAISSNRPQPLFFSMKSVCDFANSEKNDDYQLFASQASARCTQLFFEKFGDNMMGNNNA